MEDVGICCHLILEGAETSTVTLPVGRNMIKGTNQHHNKDSIIHLPAMFQKVSQKVNSMD